jgi:hypothetical protein
MNKISLYIEVNRSWELLDFDDSLTIKKTFLNLSNPWTSDLGYSFSSTLPLTKRNAQILGYDVKLSQRYDVRVFVNDVRVSEGYIEIRKKKKDSLQFNYVEASSNLLSILDRDYEVELSIDTEELLGEYLDPDATGLTHVEFPHIMEAINTQTDFAIGIVDDGKRNLVYEVDNPFTINSNYETDMTGTHPRVFRTRDFYMSHRVNSLMSKIIDKVNEVNGTTITFNSDSNKVKDFLDTTYFILKNSSDSRIAKNFSGQNTKPALILDLDFDSEDYTCINPYNLFDVKIATDQLQTLSESATSGTGESGVTRYSFTRYTYIDDTTSRFLSVSGSLTTSTLVGGYMRNFVRVFTSPLKETLVQEFVTLVTTPSTTVSFDHSSMVELFNGYYVETELQVNGTGNFTMTIRDRDEPLDEYNYVLSEVYSFNPLKILKEVVEQTNTRLSWDNGSILLLDKDYGKYTSEFTKYTYIETEESDLVFYGSKDVDNLPPITIDKVDAVSFTTPSFLSIPNTEVSVTTIVSSSFLSGSINYKPAYVTDPLPYTIPSIGDPYTTDGVELLGIRDVNGSNNVNLDTTNYVSEEDYVRLNTGQRVLINGKYVGLDDIDGVEVTVPGISGGLTTYKSYLTRNPGYVEPTSHSGSYEQYSYSPLGDTMFQTFYDTNISVDDLIIPNYLIVAVVYSQGIEYREPVLLTGTPPASINDFVVLVEDAYDLILSSMGVTELSTDTFGDTIFWVQEDPELTYYIKLEITDLLNKTVVPSTQLCVFSAGLHLTPTGALNGEVGILKSFDYPAFTLARQLNPLLFAYNNPDTRAYYYRILYTDSNDVSNARNKLPLDYIFTQVVVEDFSDVTSLAKVERKRTVDDAPTDTSTLYFASDGEYLGTYIEASTQKPAWQQFKWIPQLSPDVVDNRVVISDNIYCVPDRTNILSSGTSAKVFINFMSQYNYLAPLLFKSAHETPIQNELNSFLWNSLYGKGLDTYIVDIPIYDYVNLIRVNPIVQIAGEDYYTIDLEYNLLTEKAKLRGIKKTTV